MGNYRTEEELTSIFFFFFFLIIPVSQYLENYPVSSASERSYGMPYRQLWINEHFCLLFHFESCKSKCVFPHGVFVLMAIAIKRRPSDRAGGATKVPRKRVQLDVQMNTFKEPDEEKEVGSQEWSTRTPLINIRARERTRSKL